MDGGFHMIVNTGDVREEKRQSKEKEKNTLEDLKNQFKICNVKQRVEMYQTIRNIFSAENPSHNIEKRLDRALLTSYLQQEKLRNTK